jgi:glycosyltransferase involved in cell wall biosynthesis
MDLRSLRPQLPRRHPRLRLCDRRDLASPAARFLAWHDNQLDVWAPFALRHARRGRWPITALHHTLSYKELLHDTYLPLLMARPGPRDCIVATSAAARDALRVLLAHVADRFEKAFRASLAFRGQVRVIPLGVDTERFRPRDRAAARVRLRLPQKALVLLWVGRLSAVDKADLAPLCDVVADLGRRDRRIMLVCAGTQRPGESYGDVLRDYARDRGLGGGRLRVMITGGGESLEQLYAAADLFVSPIDNVQEAFGLTVVEAMASGVPQIAADWDGYRDTVADGATGFLVPTLWARCTGDVEADALLRDTAHDHLALSQSVAVDPRALGAAIERLARDDALRAEMGRRSRARAVAHFDWQVVIAQFERLWDELAATPHGPLDARAPLFAHAAPPYFRAFSHYATRRLGPRDRVSLTERGWAVDSARAFPLPYAADWHYLDASLLMRIVREIRTARKDGAVEIGRLPMSRTRPASGRPEVTLRHLLWLLKYGYIAVRE